MISNSARPSAAPTTMTAPIQTPLSATHADVCCERTHNARHAVRAGNAVVPA